MDAQDEINKLYTDIDNIVNEINNKIENEEGFTLGIPLAAHILDKAQEWKQLIENNILPELESAEGIKKMAHCQKALEELISNPPRADDLITKAYKELEKVYL